MTFKQVEEDLRKFDDTEEAKEIDRMYELSEDGRSQYEAQA